MKRRTALRTRWLRGEDLEASREWSVRNAGRQFNIQQSDENLLSSTAIFTPRNESAVLASNPPEVAQHPSNFKARREALKLTTSQLARLLGLSSNDVEIIETISLGEEVAFLHNLALSALELGAIEPFDL